MELSEYIPFMMRRNKPAKKALYNLFDTKDYEMIAKIILNLACVGDYTTLTWIIYNINILNMIKDHKDEILYNALFICYYSCNHEGLVSNYGEVKKIKIYLLKYIINFFAKEDDKKTYLESIFRYLRRGWCYNILLEDVLKNITIMKKRLMFIDKTIQHMIKCGYELHMPDYLKIAYSAGLSIDYYNYTNMNFATRNKILI